MSDVYSTGLAQIIDDPVLPPPADRAPVRITVRPYGNAPTGDLQGRATPPSPTPADNPVAPPAPQEPAAKPIKLQPVDHQPDFGMELHPVDYQPQFVDEPPMGVPTDGQTDVNRIPNGIQPTPEQLAAAARAAGVIPSNTMQPGPLLPQRGAPAPYTINNPQDIVPQAHREAAGVLAQPYIDYADPYTKTEDGRYVADLPMTPNAGGKVQPAQKDYMNDVIAGADVASNLIGLPGLKIGAAATKAILGGVMAKNAPKLALTKAIELEKAGQHPSVIWRLTGWERGAGGDWRFEIPDTNARFVHPDQYRQQLRTQAGDLLKETDEMWDRSVTPARLDPARADEYRQKKEHAMKMLARSDRPVPLPEVLPHPEFFQNYPRAKDISVVVEDMGPDVRGEFRSGNGTQPVIAISPEVAADPQQARSVILHEISHWVQGREGFPQGGSYKTPEVAAEVEKQTGARRSSLLQEAAALRDGYDNYIMDRNGGMHVEAFRELHPKEFLKLDEQYQKENPHVLRRMMQIEAETHHLNAAHQRALRKAYRSLAGEAEARAVQERAGFTPRELEIHPPSASEDTPRDKQIVVRRPIDGPVESGGWPKALTDNKDVWWHGTASGDLRGGSSGLHLGTFKAATQALEARIGIPADGRGWVGDRAYGDTLLAGRRSIQSGRFGEYRESGFNTGSRYAGLPEEDFYPGEYFKRHPDQHPKYPDGTPMPLTVKPVVQPFKITGAMTNTRQTPHADFKANGYMRGMLKRGNAKRGFFYKNVGEDSGSISAVVPNGSHVEAIDAPRDVYYSQRSMDEPALNQGLHEPTEPVGTSHGERATNERAGAAPAETNEASVRRPGGGFSLEEEKRAAETARGVSRPLQGLPAEPVTIRTPDGDRPYVAGPIERIHRVADEYMKSTGRKYEPLQTYMPVDEKRAKLIADAYAKMPHAPNDPKVKASYDALIKETVDQLKAIHKSGLQIEFIKPGMANPYEESPRLAHIDVRDNNHLWVFPTETGFGTGDLAKELANNPLLQSTGIVIDGHELLANDAFRIVHDYFGHLKDGVGFRASGEENAWRSHSRMYSPLARKAMTTETRGQNSWLNYGPHGEKNRTAKSADTIYADQKSGLMPDWTHLTGAADPYIAPKNENTGKSIVNAGVDNPPNPKVQTVADPHRMMFPGIYENPRLIAQEAASRVAPEDLDMKRLWGVSRGDLDEMAKGRVGNRDPDVYQGPGTPRGSLAAQSIQTPKNTQRLIDILAEAGKKPGIAHADAWYVMEPVYKRMEELFGPQEAPARFTRLMTMMGMASPGTDVLREINRGTAAHHMAAQGRFGDFAKYGGTPKEFRPGSFPTDLTHVEPHPYHRTSHAEPMQKYLDTGKIQSKEAKVPLYVQASGSEKTGFQTRGPVPDAHFSRGVGLSDTRKGPTDVGASASRAEYQTLQPWWEKEVAGQLGMESVPAQARLWTVLGPKTGVDSALGQGKLELLTKMIMRTAQRLRISPEKARDLVLSGKASAGALAAGAVGLGAAAQGDDESATPLASGLRPYTEGAHAN